MPQGRTQLYAIWRSCERLGIRPPEVPASWDDLGDDDENNFTKAHILMYDQIRTREEDEIQELIIKAGAMRPRL